MIEQLSLSTAQLGIIGSAFFISYAVGQLINGFISDRVHPYKFIIFALFGSISLNAMVSVCNTFIPILLFWALNGYFQSVFWASLTRILSLFSKPEKHSTVATVMSSSMVAGFVVSWVIIPSVLGLKSWKSYFIVPVILGTIMLVIWITVAFKDKSSSFERKKVKFEKLSVSLKNIKDNKLLLLCSVCCILGFIKESITLWSPTVISNVITPDIIPSVFLLLILPFGNLAGILLTKTLLDKFAKNEMSALVGMFLAISSCAVLLTFFFNDNNSLSILLIAGVSAISFGCNSILLSFIPLKFTNKNMVATIVGILDFSSYIGASISSFVIGSVLIDNNFFVISGVWSVIAVVAALICILINIFSRRFSNEKCDKQYQ